MNLSRKERAFVKIYKNIEENMMRESDNDCNYNSDKTISSFTTSEYPNDIPRIAIDIRVNNQEPYEQIIYNPFTGDSPADDFDKHTIYPHACNTSPQEIEVTDQETHYLP
jgi:hypothetical protein